MRKFDIPRLKIDLTSEELMDLWNGVYHKGNKHELKGETYQQVTRVNMSEFSDGPSWDYIIQRQSDDKFFKFNIWDAGEHNGYVFEDEYIIEVFEKRTTIYE